MPLNLLAFTSFVVADKHPLKIECLDTWGHKLVVGTTEGILLVYDVKEKSDPNESVGGMSPYYISNSDTQIYKEFTKKKTPITQLNVAESHSIMISLTDGMISVHDLPSFNLRGNIPKSKGCHLYALDTSKPYLSLCVAVKRKLVIFNWDGGDFVEAKELAIPDLANALVWADQLVCVGFRREYNLINVQTGAITEAVSTAKTGNITVNLIPPDQLLLGKNNLSFFIGLDGKPTRRYGLSWSESPILIGYKFPYVLAVNPRMVEARMVTEAQDLLQTLPLLKGVKCLTDKRDVYVASPTQIWRLVPVPLINNIDQLVKENQFIDAIRLCDSLDERDSDKGTKQRQTKISYAYHLFSQGQYGPAMDLFYELDVDPLQVIGLFTDLLPRDLRQKYTFPITVTELVGVPADKAHRALITYLTQRRTPAVAELTKSQNWMITHPSDNMDYTAVTNPDVIIDMSMLRALIKVNDTTILASFLRSPNFCHVKEAQRVLTQEKKSNELVLLYQYKGLHREALEQLQKLQNGPHDTIQYLKSLGKQHMPLILEFSRWVLSSAPDDALSIFIEERAPVDRLPPEQVLPHLKTYRAPLVIPYLEYIIGNQKYAEKGAEFHNELIFQYLEAALSVVRSPLYQEKKVAGNLEAAGTEPGLLGDTRKKLLKFLETSQFYIPEKMLSRFPVEDLYEERAILLSRIGQHEPALNIYAHKLKNIKMAEDYCARHYNSEREESRDVYLSLFQVYLKPPPPQKPMIEPAMNLLNKHYMRIDTPKALDLLPPNISISQLYPFFEAVLREMTKNRRNNQVVKNLLKSENLQIREQLIKARSKVIKITEDRSCPVCNKRLGTSVFACYPTGVVVHFMCLANQQKKNAGNA